MKIEKSKQVWIIAIVLLLTTSIIIAITYYLNPNIIQFGSKSNLKCVVAGCSGEICADESEAADKVSICIYSNRYACVKKTKCEVQTDGKCGWTATAEYSQCLMDADSTPAF
jgi:eight-cysteine-cluster-containing protein